MPNPPGANPLVAERAFPTSDFWGHTGVARRAAEMIGISNRLLTPCHPRLRRLPRGPFSYQGVSTRGVRHSPDYDTLRMHPIHGMAMFKRTFARTIRNTSGAPHMKIWGFEAKGPESSPELCLEHCHGISLPYFLRPRPMFRHCSQHLGWHFRHF